MKTIPANISMSSVIFWVGFASLILVGKYFFDYTAWVLLIVPFNFLGQIALRKFTKYKLGEKDLVVKVFSDITTIELEKIRSHSIEEPSFFKKYFFGYPKKVIFVKYNKFDDMEILSTDKALLDRLASYA